MKLKMRIDDKVIYVSASFAEDFVRELNNVIVRAAGVEKDWSSEGTKPFEPIELELRTK